MLKQAYNDFEVVIKLRADSPVMVKDGRYGQAQKDTFCGGDIDLKKRMPDLIPISRATDEQLRAASSHKTDIRAALEKLPFYIPGTSMRGAWRTTLERLLRSLGESGKPWVCDPLQDGEVADISCSTTLTARQGKGENFSAYAASCPVCRLFGSTVQASRISISDGEVDPAQRGRLAVREHTRINRRDGRVAGPPLKFFGLEGTSFIVHVRVRNFELQHLLLMGFLLSELAGKNVPLGSGKNKGYGRVEGSFDGVKLTWFGMKRPDKLRGIGDTDAVPAKFYGIAPSPVVPELPSGTWLTEELDWRHSLSLTRTEFEACWKQLKLGSMPPLSTRATAGARS